MSVKVPGPIDAVPLPRPVSEALLSKVPQGELAHWAVEAIVVEAAREHIISRRKAASLLGLLDYDARQEFFERHRLTNEYTLEMLEMDREALEHLRSIA